MLTIEQADLDIAIESLEIVKKEIKTNPEAAEFRLETIILALKGLNLELD